MKNAFISICSFHNPGLLATGCTDGVVVRLISFSGFNRSRVVLAAHCAELVGGGNGGCGLVRCLSYSAAGGWPLVWTVRRWWWCLPGCSVSRRTRRSNNKTELHAAAQVTGWSLSGCGFGCGSMNGVSWMSAQCRLRTKFSGFVCNLGLIIGLEDR